MRTGANINHVSSLQGGPSNGSGEAEWRCIVLLDGDLGVKEGIYRTLGDGPRSRLVQVQGIGRLYLPLSCRRGRSSVHPVDRRISIANWRQAPWLRHRGARLGRSSNTLRSLLAQKVHHHIALVPRHLAFWCSLEIAPVWFLALDSRTGCEATVYKCVGEFVRRVE